MTVEGGASGAGAPADEDPFEEQMRLSYEPQVRVSTVQRYVKSQTLDQLEEWMKEKPIPCTSNDKFSQEGRELMNSSLPQIYLLTAPNLSP